MYYLVTTGLFQNCKQMQLLQTQGFVCDFSEHIYAQEICCDLSICLLHTKQGEVLNNIHS